MPASQHTQIYSLFKLIKTIFHVVVKIVTFNPDFHFDHYISRAFSFNWLPESSITHASLQRDGLRLGTRIW